MHFFVLFFISCSLQEQLNSFTLTDHYVSLRVESAVMERRECWSQFLWLLWPDLDAKWHFAASEWDCSFSKKLTATELFHSCSRQPYINPCSFIWMTLILTDVPSPWMLHCSAQNGRTARIILSTLWLQNVSPSTATAPAKGDKKPAAAAPGVNTAPGKSSHAPTATNHHSAPSPTNGVVVSSLPWAGTGVHHWPSGCQGTAQRSKNMGGGGGGEGGLQKGRK